MWHADSVGCVAGVGAGEAMSQAAAARQAGQRAVIPAAVRQGEVVAEQQRQAGGRAQYRLAGAQRGRRAQKRRRRGR